MNNNECKWIETFMLCDWSSSRSRENLNDGSLECLSLEFQRGRRPGKNLALCCLVNIGWRNGA